MTGYKRARVLGESRVSFQHLNRVFAVGLLLVGGWTATSPRRAWAQEVLTRKVKTKVVPAFPELARRLNLSGMVKIRVTVAPNGTVKDAKLVGGHPLLANPALDAVLKWRYEAGPQESTGIVEIYFAPNR
jgi:protein TonB